MSDSETTISDLRQVVATFVAEGDAIGHGFGEDVAEHLGVAGEAGGAGDIEDDVNLISAFQALQIREYFLSQRFHVDRSVLRLAGADLHRTD